MSVSDRFICLHVQGVSGALAVLMKDAIKPTLMQTLEVSDARQPFAPVLDLFLADDASAGRLVRC